jgi:carbon storage regulator CsrA
MLVLSRHRAETVVLTLPDGRRVTIAIIEIRDHSTRVRLGIDAPADVTIHRGEVQERVDAEGGITPPPANSPTPHDAPQSAGNGAPRDRRAGGRANGHATPTDATAPGLGGYVPRKLRECR